MNKIIGSIGSNFRRESTTAESNGLNVDAIQSPRASCSAMIQLPFRYNNISHVEASHYLLNQFYDILNGDLKRY